jgi:acetylornithine/succinyldiaminopimelate/putrescine aminotransferase
MKALGTIRQFVKTAGIKTITPGVSDALLSRFANDSNLKLAAERALAAHSSLQGEFPSLMKLDEKDALVETQKGFLQFYDPTAVNPYIPIGAAGNWMVTHTGAAIYITDGYGMLGLGHAPPKVLDALAQPHVIANVMTASFSQHRFNDALRKEIGHTRPHGCPYESFLCLNSGSESVSLAMRIADVDAKRMTSSSGPHNGRKSCLISLKGSFHGRTERPAHASDSTRSVYDKFLKSFSNKNQELPLYTVEPNNIEDLTRVFEEIEELGLHAEVMLMEPVMGEGNPGLAITREFYDAARALTDKYRSLLLVDSIQAGMRARGTLSIMDYPGFQDASPPDFETYSKALNAGQYPLSVLALGPRVQEIYARGLYGNTMTTNPRGLDVASSVLSHMTPELRKNIVEMGKYFKAKLDTLRTEHPDVVESTSGTGMLVASHLKPEWRAYGHPLSLEVLARRNGLGVIHGGKNALRFTPSFTMTEAEADLSVDIVNQSIVEMRKLNDEGAYNN